MTLCFNMKWVSCYHHQLDWLFYDSGDCRWSTTLINHYIVTIYCPINFAVSAMLQWQLNETVLSYTMLCCAVLYCVVLCCTVLSCPVLSCPVLSCPVLSCLYCTLYCTVLSWTLYCTVPCHAILCCTVQCCAVIELLWYLVGAPVMPHTTDTLISVSVVCQVT